MKTIGDKEYTEEQIKKARTVHLSAERALAISNGAEPTEEEDWLMMNCDDCMEAGLSGELPKAIAPKVL